MNSLAALLARTSRTFALSIPRLPDPTRHAVTLAYLLFRIADTFEDAAAWPRAQRSAALDAFLGILRDPRLAETGALPPGVAETARAWRDARPSEHDGYLDLVAETPRVLDGLAALSASARRAVLHHAARTAEGMKGFVAQSTAQGGLRLGSLDDLRGYCYVVAGIVGELLTDLFVMDAPALAPAAPTLQRHARAFGEGLQLVNILKDATDDARDGRTYLPPAVPRESVLDLARRDLDEAVTYVHALQSHDAPRGFVEFTALPVALARATLDKLAVEGPGAKLPRATVMSLAADLDQRLDQGAPALGIQSSD